MPEEDLHHYSILRFGYPTSLTFPPVILTSPHKKGHTGTEGMVPEEGRHDDDDDDTRLYKILKTRFGLY